MNKYTSFASVTVLALLIACGGGSSTPADSTDTTTPTIESVADAGETALDADGSDVTTDDDGYFIVTFSEAMDDTSVTGSGHIALTCTTAEEVALTTTVESADDYTYRITLDNILTVGDVCELTFTANITDSNSNALAAVTYDITITAGTAPSISSVTTDDSGADTALSATAGDTRVSGAASDAFFTITFGEAMDTSTIIEDNIALTCNDEVVAIGTPVSDDNTIWTIPVESDLTGYIACFLTVGTGVQSATGIALAEAATYAFNTQCSTSDDFFVDTLGFEDESDFDGDCWTYAQNGAPVPETSSTSFTIETLDQYLLFTAPADSVHGQYRGLFKNFNAGSFTATLELFGMSGGGGIECDLYAHNLSDPTKNAKARFASGSNCLFLVNNEPGDSIAGCGTDTLITPNTPFYLQLIWDGTAASAKYGTSLSELSDMDILNDDGTVDLGYLYQVGILCESGSAGNFVRMGSFTIDATATDPGTQY